MWPKIKKFIQTVRFEYLLLFAVLAGGFGVRLYKINNPIADWHSWRQADTASVSRMYVKNGIDLLRPRYHDISSIQTGIFNPNGYRMVELPVYNALNAILTNNFHSVSLEVWARLLTIFTALTTAFFLYLIGKNIGGKWLGILSAFFYLFIPYNIYFTRVILPDPMGVTFAVISVWAFLKFSEKEKNLFLLISAIFFSLAMLIKPYLGFYIFPIIYLAVKKYGIKNILKNRKIWIKAFVFSLIAFAPFFAYRIWESRFPEGIPFYQWAFNGNGIRFKPSFWYWIFGIRLSHLILGGLGVIPFVFGILNTKVKNLLSHYLLLGVMFYVTVVATANVMHDYYQILIIPAVALGLAAGSVFLWQQNIFNKLISRSVLLVSVLVMLITGWTLIKEDYKINHPEILEAGKEADKILPKDAIVVAPYNGDTAFLYATNRIGWPAVDDSIDNIIKKGAGYYISVDLGSSDTVNFSKMFKTVEKTDKFIILNLRERLVPVK